MDFELTRSQKEIQRAVQGFAKKKFDKDLARELEKKHQYPTEILRKAGELGFIGIHFPEQFSGQGLGLLENILVAEAFCAQDSTIGSAIILSSFASECVLRFGNNDF
jgi:alkylation response protein AidB-like acyl-CoA dehydrogenase